ncbi:MAG: hypothetical protein ACYDBB_14015 [Armatimonadota bacterium]
MRIFYWLAVLLVIPLLAGCARFPSTVPPDTNPPVTLFSEITVRGQIDPTMYYFLALNTTGNTAIGPIPVVTGPELGNGWGTLSGQGGSGPLVQPPFWVQYHNGAFRMFRNGVDIGPPFRGQVLAADGTPSLYGPHIQVEVDIRDIVEPTQSLPSILQLNWITDQTIDTSPANIGLMKDYDGIGPTGNDYLDAVPTDQSWTRESGVNGVPDEPARDTTDLANIDLIHWLVEVRLR